MRKFLVGAYWGGLLAGTSGLLPVVLFRPGLLPAAFLQGLQQLTPALILAGFALLTSVLAAGTMLVLRELAAVRGMMERAARLPAEIPARLSNWRGVATSLGPKVTTPCSCCGRTNWTEARSCVDCGAPIGAGDGAAAR